MNTYLFAWNPKRWTWADIQEDVDACKKGLYEDRWSCGVTKKIKPEDRAFLIKLGPEEPKGIMASGAVVSSPFEDEHYADTKKTAWYVQIRFDVLLHPGKEEILPQQMLREKIPTVHWSPQGSGITIPPTEAALLESLWSTHLIQIGLAPQTCSEEIATPERYWEGALRRISVNAYEREPRARRACLAHHGYACSICGFDFEKAYGDIGNGFIHVHHLRQLSEIGDTYEVDPIKDLMPVCPNCHAMLHKQTPALSISELKKLLLSGMGGNER